MHLIKLQIVRCLICLLLYPEWQAKNENLTLSIRADHFVKSAIKHTNLILNHSSSCKNIYLIALHLNGCTGFKNSCKKILKSYFNTDSIHEFKLIIDKSIADKIMYNGLEWYLYINIQFEQLHNSLCITSQKGNWFYLYRPLVSSISIKYLSKFLHILKVNLKSVKCKIHKCVKDILYLSDIACVNRNNADHLFKVTKKNIAHLILDIKQKLYYKNMQGYQKTNSSISPPEVKLRIEKTLSLWKFCYSNILSQAEIIRINRVIDHMFYKWQMN